LYQNRVTGPGPQ